MWLPFHPVSRACRRKAVDMATERAGRVSDRRDYSPVAHAPGSPRYRLARNGPLSLQIQFVLPLSRGDLDEERGLGDGFVVGGDRAVLQSGVEAVHLGLGFAGLAARFLRRRGVGHGHATCKGIRGSLTRVLLEGEIDRSYAVGCLPEVVGTELVRVQLPPPNCVTSIWVSDPVHPVILSNVPF